MDRRRYHVDWMELDFTADFEDPANYLCVFCGTPVTGDAEVEECPVRVEMQDDMDPQLIRATGMLVGALDN